jgi:hypothetical protein
MFISAGKNDCQEFYGNTDSLSLPHYWLRSTMDSISDSDSEDAGSIPAGVTRRKIIDSVN